MGGRQYGPDFESVLSHCEVYEDGIWKVYKIINRIVNCSYDKEKIKF